MTEITTLDVEQAARLIRFAHGILNRPISAGPMYAKYKRKNADAATNALWEAHLLLTGGHAYRDERGDQR